jgi:cell division septal protein FtsQ
MALAATSSMLYIAQRKRLRGKRLLAQAWLLGKAFLGCACCIGLMWGVITVYHLGREAEYFRVRTLDITGLTMLTRAEVLYLLGISEETTLWQLDLPRMGA